MIREVLEGVVRGRRAVLLGLCAGALCVSSSSGDLYGFASGTSTATLVPVTAELSATRIYSGGGPNLLTMTAVVTGLTPSEISAVYACRQIDSSTCGLVADLDLITSSPLTYQKTVILTAALESALASNKLAVKIEDTGGTVVSKGRIKITDSSKMYGGGLEVTPPHPGPAAMSGEFGYDSATGALTGSVSVTALQGQPTAARIHSGPPGVNGPVIASLTAMGAGAWSAAGIVLTPVETLAMVDGNIYVQIDTVAFPTGALRGQIEPGFLNVDTESLSITTGGRQKLFLDAGVKNANRLFVLLGSLTGTVPGFPVGSVTLPLNPDAYFFALLASPNTIVSPSIGFLDQAGRAESQFTLPPQLQLVAPINLDHAYMLYNVQSGAFDLASNAQSLTLVP